MALLQEASLIVTANAQKAGKLYSIIPQSGAGDFNVTRATSATRVDSQGLIEIPRTNLFLRSEEFENATWSRQNIANIISNTSLSPINTLTADKIIPDTTSNQHRILQFANFTGQGVLSVYAKADGYNFLSLGYGGGAAGGTIIFDLSNGTISGTAGGFVPSIENVGNGWYRCSIYRDDLGGGINISYWIIVRNNNTTNNYVGDGTSGILVWGAQLETSVSPTTYIPTTSVVRTRFQGITQDGSTASNIPRLDYTNASCPSILVEPQRTNLVLRSEELNVAPWSSTGINVTPNTIISPSGLLNADTITGDGNLTLHQTFQTNISYVSGTTYTFSVYVKKGTNDFIQISLPNNTFFSVRFANFDINTGVIGNVSADVTASILNAGNGWYRCIVTSTASATITSTISLLLITSSTSIRNENNTLNTSVNVWGAQLEVGANATSYIPTVASTVTRNADVIDNTNMSTLIGQTEGAMFVDFNYERLNPQADSFIATISNGTISNSLNFAVLTNGFFAATLRTSGSIILQFTINAAIFTFGRKKIVISYKSGETKLYVNGVKIGSTNTSAFTFPVTINKFNLGSSWSGSGLANNTINSAALWKTVLTDSQAIQLTTP